MKNSKKTKSKKKDKKGQRKILLLFLGENKQLNIKLMFNLTLNFNIKR